MIDPIQLSGFTVATVSRPDEVVAERDRLLTIARKGNTITTQEGAQRVGAILEELGAYTEQIEAGYEKAKAPIREAGRQIDALKHELLDAAAAEKARLSKLLGTWTAEQERLAKIERQRAAEREQAIIDEANKKAAAERQRLADEQKAIADKAAEEKAAADKKAAAEQAELDKKKEEARQAADSAEFDRLQAEQDRLDAVLAEQEKQRLAQVEADQKAAADAAAKASEAHVDRVETEIVENRVRAAGVTAAKVEGVSTRGSWEFEVTSVTALYEASPLLVKLTPDKVAIKKALGMLEEGQSLPGVKHWRTFKASAKPVQPLAIE